MGYHGTFLTVPDEVEGKVKWWNPQEGDVWWRNPWYCSSTLRRKNRVYGFYISVYQTWPVIPYYLLYQSIHPSIHLSICSISTGIFFNLMNITKHIKQLLDLSHEQQQKKYIQYTCILLLIKLYFWKICLYSKRHWQWQWQWLTVTALSSSDRWQPDSKSHLWSLSWILYSHVTTRISGYVWRLVRV